MTSRTTTTEFQAAVKAEHRRACARYQRTGVAPTERDSPHLMAVWLAARSKLVLSHPGNAVSHLSFKGMHFQVASIWDYWSRLHLFTLRDLSGALVLVGDGNGVIFTDESDQPTGASFQGGPSGSARLAEALHCGLCMPL